MTSKQYWLRVAFAWLLLQLAGRVMKEAEKGLQAAITIPLGEPILNGEVVEEAVNG